MDNRTNDEFIKGFNEFLDKTDDKEATVRQLQDKILTINDAKFSWVFVSALIETELSNLLDIKAHEKIIIDSKDLYYIYKFARDIKGANIPLLQNEIIDSKDLYYIYKFAEDIKGANISLLQNEIINSKNLYYIYIFARDVEGANISLLGNAVINSKNLEQNYMFAKDIKGANIEAHKKVIEDSGNIAWLILFENDVVSSLPKITCKKKLKTTKSDENE